MDYFIIIEGNPILNLISSCACGSQPKDFSIFPSTLLSFEEIYLSWKLWLGKLKRERKQWETKNFIFVQCSNHNEYAYLQSP